MEGRCPQCLGAGLAGAPCASPGCALRRYHCIPSSFVGDTPIDDAMLGRVVSDFLIVGVLGSGGFGNVHHVLQLPLRARPVQGALKRIRPPGQADQKDREVLLTRFESEADALASLSHPNIVRLLKAGVDGDTPYLVLELVTDAETLERELEDQARQGTTMSEAEIVPVIDQILNALEAAHAQDIVHRDVKPGNVMLQRVAGYDVFVRVLDFGLAKFVAETSQTERVMGTLDYMAPEQLRGKGIGPWTDLYALGLMLIAMLTGRPAFSSDRVVLVNEKLDPAYNPLQRALAGHDIDGAIAAFIRRATAYERSERFQNVAAFRRAFHDAFRPLGRDRQRKGGKTRELTAAPTPLHKSAEREVDRDTTLMPADALPVRLQAAPQPAPAAVPGPRPVVAVPAQAARATPPPAEPLSTSGTRWPLLEAVDRLRKGRQPFDPALGAPPGNRPPAPSPAPRAARVGDAPTLKPVVDTVDAEEPKPG